MIRGSRLEQRVFWSLCFIIGGLFGWIYLYALGRIEHGIGDFQHFYWAAAAMWEHIDIYASWKHGYIYPPLLAFLYMPLSFLPLQTAAVVLLTINTGLVLLTLWLCSREFTERFGAPSDRVASAGVALIAALVVVDKVKGELRMWQTDVLMLLMFTLALRWLDRRPLLAGMALGLAFNIKYLAVVFLPYLILRRRWRACAGFVAGAVLFALLPAVQSGWNQNLRDLRTATAGLSDLFGIERAPGAAAKINPMGASFSLSITSACARAVGSESASVAAVALAAIIAAACLGVAALLYHRAGMPLWKWQAEARQREQPFRTMIGVEWAGLIVAALAFSPQTNTRHLYLLLLVQIAAATMLVIPRRGVSVALLLAGMIVLWLSLVLPPGTRSMHDAVRFWRQVSGPSWCMLLMYATLLSTALRYVQAPNSHGAWKGPLTGFLPRWPLFARRPPRGIDSDRSELIA